MISCYVSMLEKWLRLQDDEDENKAKDEFNAMVRELFTDVLLPVQRQDLVAALL